MATGLRIHHPTLTNGTLKVPGRTGPDGRQKIYWVRIDSEGDCIVSETVWERLQQAEAAGAQHGFIVLNEVENPPAQTINGENDPRFSDSYVQVGDQIIPQDTFDAVTLTQSETEG